MPSAARDAQRRNAQWSTARARDTCTTHNRARARATYTCREQSCRFFLEVLVGVILRPSYIIGCARGAFSLWYATRSFPGLSVARVVPPFFDDIDEVFSTDAACASPGAALEGEGFLALGRSTSHCSTVLLKVTSKLPRKGLLLSLLCLRLPPQLSLRHPGRSGAHAFHLELCTPLRHQHNL